MRSPRVKGSSGETEPAAVELRRVQALVTVDLAVADELHASDFELITPGGEARSKEQYLGRIASGQTDYQVWEPDEISARASGDVGCVRYRSTMNAIIDGHETGLRQLWHKEFYEKNNGRWQVVWSHATTVRT